MEEKITASLLNTSVYKNAASIHIYKSLSDEVNTFYILNDAYKSGKLVYFPADDPYDNVVTDIVIVPGRKFDRQLTRHGRGGGYYDRFLCNTSAIKIGVCFHDQLVNRLVRKPHDIPMDIIVTEKRILGIANEYWAKKKGTVS